MLLVWVFVGILAVSGVKYYTALGTRRLERRMNNARTDFHKVKGRLQEAKKRQLTLKAEEELYVERIRIMKDLINGLNIRLSERDKTRPDIIAESMKASQRTDIEHVLVDV